MKAKLNILAIGLLLMVFAGNILAQPKRPFIYDKLNLSPQQINQIDPSGVIQIRTKRKSNLLLIK